MNMPDTEIQAENLRVMQAIYFAAQLEELKVFEVLDKLVELFQNGMLALCSGSGRDVLGAYWKQPTKRMTRIERRSLYSRAFGFPGGDSNVGSSNREFNDLWLRFVSAVSSFARQRIVENLLGTNTPLRLSQDYVKRSARDLAANLSLHGYGIGYSSAAELQTRIEEIIAVLSDPEIRAAYRAQDMWQVVDQIGSLELGGAGNSIRCRTLASSGATIISWLAEHTALLVSAADVPLLDEDQLRNPNSERAGGPTAIVNPSDNDLVHACDQWLAISGTADNDLDETSQPTSHLPRGPLA